MSAGGQFFTVAELADRWQCDRSMVYYEIRAGRLRALQLGKQGKRISRDELARFERDRTGVQA